MIVHEINKYAVPAPVHVPYSPPYSNPAWGQQPVHSPHLQVPLLVTENSSKIVYARWIEQRKNMLKPGEYCIPENRIMDWQGRTADDFHKVVSWQEIQHMCTFDKHGRPRALCIINRNKEYLWVCHLDWRYAHPNKPEWTFTHT